MNIDISVSGLENIQRNLNQRLRKVKKVTREGMTDVVLDGLSKSVQKAPVDMGDLRGSGYAKINNVIIATGTNGGIQTHGQAPEETKLVGEIGFNTPYALIQHENLEFQHSNGGEAKYLEKTVSQNANKWLTHIASRAREIVD